MLNRVRQIGKYILYILATNIIFGLIYYFVFSWLVGHSITYAYLGCLMLIIIGLLLDRYTQHALTPKKSLKSIMQLSEKDREPNHRLLQAVMGSYVSFKTILFIFYIFILIASQVITINPSLVDETLGSFITANSYGIVLVIALDMVIESFTKDRKMMKSNSEQLKKSMVEGKELE